MSDFTPDISIDVNVGNASNPDVSVEIDVGTASLPEGGEPGQVLTKTKEGVQWQDPAPGGGGGVVSVNGQTGEVQITPENIGAQPKGDYLAKETDPTVPAWAKQPTKPSYTAEEVGALPADTPIPAVPTKVSAFENDVGYLTKHQDLSAYAKKSEIPDTSAFITRAVTDLVNYYTKAATYSREEIDQKVSAIPKFSIEVVSALPAADISETTVYLVPGGAGDNLYTEYIYVSGAWEILGSQRVDLTGYATQNWTLEQLTGYQPKGNYQPAGDYALKGEIPTVPTNVSAFENDAGYAKQSEVPTELSQLSGDEAHRVVTDAEKAAWNAKSDFSGNYADLNGAPTIPTVPTKVSAFENDAKYLTEVPPEYVTETELEGKGYLTKHLTVDTAFSTSSANPLQNKVVTNQFNKIARRMSEVAFNGTTNPIAYYEIGRMVDFASGDNRGGITFRGRLGHWLASSIANFNILLTNRGGVKASIFAQGNVAGALNCCDIEVYRQADNSDIIYMKTNSYWCFDLEHIAYQHTTNYINVPTTPTGELVWKLSEAPIISVDFDGNMTANGLSVNGVSFSSLASRVQAIENADYITEADRPGLVNDVIAALPMWEGGSY